MTTNIEPAALVKLAAAGGSFSVSVLAAKEGWTVCVHDEAGDHVLQDRTAKATAVFDVLDAAERHLRALGIVQFEVDGRMDRHSDDPGYDAWFRRQVQEALDDPAPFIPHDEAMRQIRAAINLDSAPSQDLMTKVSQAGFAERHMRYRVALRHSEEGVSVWVPALPGCYSQGATEEEAIDNIKIAIEEYLSVLDEQFHDVGVKEVEVAV